MDPRPRRTRLRPLEYWANERVVYEQTALGVPMITGVLTDAPRVAASAASSRAHREEEGPTRGNAEHSSLPKLKAERERAAERSSLPKMKAERERAAESAPLPKKRKAAGAREKDTAHREQESPLRPSASRKAARLPTEGHDGRHVGDVYAAAAVEDGRDGRETKVDNAQGCSAAESSHQFDCSMIDKDQHGSPAAPHTSAASPSCHVSGASSAYPTSDALCCSPSFASHTSLDMHSMQVGSGGSTSGQAAGGTVLGHRRWGRDWQYQVLWAGSAAPVWLSASSITRDQLAALGLHGPPPSS